MVQFVGSSQRRWTPSCCIAPKVLLVKSLSKYDVETIELRNHWIFYLVVLQKLNSTRFQLQPPKWNYSFWGSLGLVCKSVAKTKTIWYFLTQSPNAHIFNSNYRWLYFTKGHSLFIRLQRLLKLQRLLNLQRLNSRYCQHSIFIFIHFVIMKCFGISSQSNPWIFLENFALSPSTWYKPKAELLLR